MLKTKRLAACQDMKYKYVLISIAKKIVKSARIGCSAVICLFSLHLLSDDVDGFLFGARRIIRSFSLNPKKSMYSYEMRDIESDLHLNRDKMIAVGLLLGNDYDPRGVPGIGLKRALDFVRSVPNDECVIDRLRRWRQVTTKAVNDAPVDDSKGMRKSQRIKVAEAPPVVTVDLLKSNREMENVNNVELSLMILAHGRIDFPNEEIIDAFRKPNVLFQETLPNGDDAMELNSSRDPTRPWLIINEGNLGGKCTAGKLLCLACGLEFIEEEYLDHVRQEHLRECHVVVQKLPDDET